MQANANISASTRKRKHFDPCACAHACICPQAVFNGEISALVLALNYACACACVASENQAEETVELNLKYLVEQPMRFMALALPPC